MSKTIILRCITCNTMLEKSPGTSIPYCPHCNPLPNHVHDLDGSHAVSVCWCNQSRRLKEDKTRHETWTCPKCGTKNGYGNEQSRVLGCANCGNGDRTARFTESEVREMVKSARLEEAEWWHKMDCERVQDKDGYWQCFGCDRIADIRSGTLTP